MDKDNSTFIANGIAKNIDSISPLDCNITAMITAQLLAEGKTKCELQNICRFIHLLLTALKTYIDC